MINIETTITGDMMILKDTKGMDKMTEEIRHYLHSKTKKMKKQFIILLIIKKVKKNQT